MGPMMESCYARRWRSPFVVGRRRPMAYLVSYRQLAQLKHELIGAKYAGYIAEQPLQSLLGWPYYVGSINPDPLPLFLPESTVRSMAGLWGSA